MVVLSTIAVALRFVSRILSKKAGLWWDDWLALVGWVWLWLLAGLESRLRSGS